MYLAHLLCLAPQTGSFNVHKIMRLFIFLCVFSIVSCTKSTPVEDFSQAPVEQANPKNLKHYLALGDSYTIGTAIGLKVIAKNGWRTLELQSAMNPQADTVQYDAVTLLIGVNDQYNGRSAATYKVNFIENLNTAIAYARGDEAKVLVISIPDYSVTPFGMNSGRANTISDEIKQYNAINKQIADSLGVRYTDIFYISRLAEMHPSLVASDGLHFSKAMHIKWLPAIYLHLQKMLAIH